MLVWWPEEKQWCYKGTWCDTYYFVYRGLEFGHWRPHNFPYMNNIDREWDSASVIFAKEKGSHWNTHPLQIFWKWISFCKGNKGTIHFCKSLVFGGWCEPHWFLSSFRSERSSVVQWKQGSIDLPDIPTLQYSHQWAHSFWELYEHFW